MATKKAPKSKTVLKINARTVFGDRDAVKAAVEAAGDEPALIMNVLGTVSAAKETTGAQFGSSTLFTGSFGAVNMQTGEVYRSNKLYLPGMAEDIVATQFAATEGALDIDLAISAIPNDREPGFAYIAAGVEDAEDALADKLAAKLNKKV